MLDDLREVFAGEIYEDPLTRRVYSVDASIFEVEPQGVVVPKSKADLIQAVRYASSHQLPITVRGAATGITGGCLGSGLVIDTSKYLNQILELNLAEGYAICQPGVVQDQLNQALAPHGYRLGPDTSTGNRATIGGMVGNNAAGARSLRFGCMVDHVLEVEVLLSNGELVRLGDTDEVTWKAKLSLPGREGEIYRSLKVLRENYQTVIDQHIPKIPRVASGYHLTTLLGQDPTILQHNLAQLVVGSEGTLGIVTEVKLRIVPKLKSTGLCLFCFDNLLDAFKVVPELLSHHPLALELIDEQIIQLGRLSPSLKGKLDWLQGNPKAIVVFEVEGTHREEVKSLLNALQAHLAEKIKSEYVLLDDPIQIENVWTLRKSGLGILLSKRTYSRAIAFIEDFSISPYQLAPFMERFCAYLESKGKSAGIYGHVGSGCMHVRPYMNLQLEEEFQLMQKMMKEVCSLVMEFGGVMSGEHGDGYIRSWLNPTLFGPELMQAFKLLKQAFDPDHLMNPGKIIPLEEVNTASLRTTPGKVPHAPQTFLNFKPEGGYELAVDLCNGNGLCRKQETVMCPSFQVTHDEFHSTRARAQALRGIIHGRLPEGDLTGQRMYDVMDLCLSCKGCKTECPSQVDMAKLKAEFLYQYQERWGYSLRTRLFASIGQLSQLASAFPRLSNWLGRSRLGRWSLNMLGIARERQLPEWVSSRFSRWFEDYSQPATLSKQVILFNDTFNEYNEPWIGQSAVKLLNELGYQVKVLPWSCCGRPALSKGDLKQARSQAEKVLKKLQHCPDLPIVGLEPSCILTLKDDYKGLLREEDPLYVQIEQVASRCMTLDQFLANLVEKGEFNLPFKTESQQVKVHGHCHQKAITGMKATLSVLKAIPGFEVSEIPSGCCGMAGSFGYEKEHYDVSMGIGELRLFPAIRNSSKEAQILASGMSCRHQIKDGTQRVARHLAELIWSHVKAQETPDG